jgi:hypothetical protein
MKAENLDWTIELLDHVRVSILALRCMVGFHMVLVHLNLQTEMPSAWAI